MLFVDGGTNRVGIGAVPMSNGSTLQVTSDSTESTNMQFTLRGASDINKQMIMGFDTTNNTAHITTQIAGSAPTPLIFKTGNVVFNEASSASDFRVESNNNANMIHVDGTNDRVGIGKDPASQPFEVGVFSVFDTGVIINESGATSNFRVEGDADANMFHVSGGANTVSVGTSSNISTSRFEVQGIDDRHNIGQKSFNLIAGTSHSCKTVEGVMAYNTASSGSQLSIPITSQTNQHRPALVELTFLSAEYNTSASVKGGFVRFAFQSLNSIGSVAEIDKSGNVASVASSGMNILINFTSAYTAGQSDHEGVMCYYRVIHEQPQYVKMWDATLN